jgi:hypothetical protein
MAYGTMKVAGGTVEMAPESAFGTAGTYVEQRLTPNFPTLPTDTHTGLDIPSTGHRHFATREAQVAYEKMIEGGIVIPCWAAGATDGTGLPQVMQHLRAAGCNVASESINTINTYVDTGEWTMTNAGTLASGTAIVVNLNAGSAPTATYPRIPVLCSAYNAGTSVFTPSMDIPAPVGTLAGQLTGETYTATPRVETLAATDTNALRAINYHAHTANESSWVYTGCAVQSIADVVFEPSQPVEFQFTYSAAKRTGPSDASIATESYQDTYRPIIIGGQCEAHVNLATFADPVTTNSRAALLRATWTPGIGVRPIPGYGTSGCINGIQGWESIYTGSKITIEVLMDKTYWADWVAGTAERYLAILQPTLSDSADAPHYTSSMGLWMPRCRIYGSPTVALEGDDVLRATVTLEPTTPAYGADESITSTGMAPWYYTIGYGSLAP